MTKTSIGLQDLRRRIYVKAKAEPSWRFWGLYVHVCKRETLLESYRLAKKNNGAPGIDGVTFDAIQDRGVETFLGELRTELEIFQGNTVRCETERWRSRRMAARSASSAFPRSGIGWHRVA